MKKLKEAWKIIAAVSLTAVLAGHFVPAPVFAAEIPAAEIPGKETSATEAPAAETPDTETLSVENPGIEETGDTGTGSGAEDDPYVVTTWADLKEKMEAGGFIRLEDDVSDPEGGSDSYLSVPLGVEVTLDLNGHTIDRALTGATRNGYVISISGTLTVNDSSSPATGAITGGWNSDSVCGGVNINGSATLNGGSLTLNGGSISGNKIERASGEAKGGGVYVGTNAIFTMNDGSITGNSVITQNSSLAQGGGVYVNAFNSNAGTFSMKGGVISGNSVATDNPSNAMGGGVYCYSEGARSIFNLQGCCMITGNTANNAENNVKVVDLISITEALDDTARIGITADAGRIITRGLSGKGVLDNFFSDDTDSIVLELDSNEVKTAAAVIAVAARAADCTEAGISVDCWKKGDKYYSEQACTNEIYPVIPALGHDMTHHPAVAATEEAFGCREHWTCSRCGKTFLDEDGNTERSPYGVITYINVPYIDADGETKTCDSFYFIESSAGNVNLGDSNQTNWYVVYGDITIDGSLCFRDNRAHVILMDGASLTVNSAGYYGIYAQGNLLAIYGQAQGTGSVRSSASGSIGQPCGIQSHKTIINGGTVTATGSKYGIRSDVGVTINRGRVTATGKALYGIDCTDSVTISGGCVTAAGNPDKATGYGINAENITIGWTSPEDCVSANSFGLKNGGSLTIADTRYLFNGTEAINGTVSDLTKLNGKTLRPAVKLSLGTGITAGGTGVVTQDDGTFACPGAAVTLSHSGRTGYTTGYTLSYAGADVTITGDVFTMPASDVTVSAVFTPNTYRVSFDKNAADATGIMEAQSFTYDEEAKALTSCGYARANYDFAGWDTEAGGGGTVYTDGQSVRNLTDENNGNVILYAQWKHSNKTAEGKARYGTTGMLELKDYIVEGGSLSVIKKMKDDDHVLSGNAVLSGTMLTWTFKDDRSLVGKKAVITIVVTDAGNHDNYELEVTLTVNDCSHSRTELRDVLIGTCSANGYSGDTYCRDCGSMIEKGHSIDKDPDNHCFDHQNGVVKIPATFLHMGVTTYTCVWCGNATIDMTDIPCLEDDKGRDLEDLREDVADLSGNDVPKIEEKTMEDGSKEETVTIGGEEVSKIITDPESGKETVESKVWIGGLKESYTYTGSDIKPAFHVYDGTKKLTEKTDYTVTYSNNKNVGTSTIKLKFKGNYSDTKQEELSFEIKPAVLGVDIIAHETGAEAKKNSQKPVPVLTRADTGKTVGIGSFNVSYDPSPVKEAGTYTATITPKKEGGNFAGSTTARITVADKSKVLSNAKVIFDKKSYAYTGQPIVPGYTLKIGDIQLAEGTDYKRVSIMGNTDPGTAAVIFEAVSGNSTGYVGSKTATFKITGKVALKDEAPFEYAYKESVPYAKGGAKPSVTVSYDGVTLKEGRDYTVSYKKNKAVTDGATAEIKIKGKGKFKDTVTKNFSVTKQTLKAQGIKATAADQFNVRSKLMKPTVTVTDVNGEKLKKGTDYTVGTDYEYTGDEDSGTVTITLTGKGNYKDDASGSIKVSYRYTKDAASDIDKTKAKKSLPGREYTGNAVRLNDADLTDILYAGSKDSPNYLVPGKDFRVTGYRDNIKTGTAKITLQGLGDYAGTKTLSFKIVRKKVDYKGKLGEGK